MTNLYSYNTFFGYRDSYNFYDIDVDKILLFRKSGNEYIIRYYDLNNATDFFETTLDDGDEFIMVKVQKNTSSVRDNHKNRLVIVLHSVFNDYHQTSLVQYIHLIISIAIQ